MKSRIIIVALILFGLCGSSIHGQMAQTKDGTVPGGILSRLVDLPETLDTPTGAAAHALASTRVPGGIVQINGCESVAMRKPWRARTSTLRDALDAIVQTEPDYSWFINDGVVNLVPKSEEPTLLQIRISRLKVKNARSIYLPLSQ